MAIITYPLNDIEYQAEDAELFHCTRTSGVYTKGHFNVTVSGTGNTIKIGKGIAWIKNSDFSGKVIAQKEAVSLNVGVSDASLDRIDAVVIQFDANQNSTNIIIKQGDANSSPNPPEVTRNEHIYELHLYHIQRKAGSAVISKSDVTDMRLDPNYCGIMADSVTRVDTSAISSQVFALIRQFQNEIADVGINGINGLLKYGPLILSENQYGTELPDNPVNGQFFVLIKE